MLSRRTLLIGGAALAALVAIVLIARALFAADDQPAFLTAEVTRGNIEQTVEATGTLEPKEMVSVGAQVSGRIETLDVRVGQSVRRGQLIAEIDAQTQTNALRTAHAELANLQAQRASRQATLARASQAFQRQQTMVAGEATSVADYQTAEADLKAAKADVAAIDAQIQQARVNVNTAEVNLGYTRVVAPMDGVVVAVVTQQGQTVNAVQAAPTIVILAQLDVMEVRAEISEADVIRVAPGMPASFTILGDPDHRYRANLLEIEPAPESIIDEVNSATAGSSATGDSAIYYNALFQVPNTDGRLRALMTAQVSIVLAQKQGVLLVPASALGTRGTDGKYAVRVLGEDGKVAERRVSVGLNNNVSAEVTGGLRLGETVVLGEATGQAAAAGGPMMGRPPF